MSDVQNDKRTRKRRPKPGDTAALRRLLWSVLREAEKVADSPDPDVKLKAASTVATLGSTYLKALDQHIIANDIEALRAEVRNLTQETHAQRPRAA